MEVGRKEGRKEGRKKPPWKGGEKKKEEGSRERGKPIFSTLSLLFKGEGGEGGGSRSRQREGGLTVGFSPEKEREMEGRKAANLQD